MQSVNSRGQHNISVTALHLWLKRVKWRSGQPYGQKQRIWDLNRGNICTSDPVCNTHDQNTPVRADFRESVWAGWWLNFQCAAVILILFCSRFYSNMLEKAQFSWFCWPPSVNPVQFPCTLIQTIYAKLRFHQDRSPLISHFGLDHKFHSQHMPLQVWATLPCCYFIVPYKETPSYGTNSFDQEEIVGNSSAGDFAVWTFRVQTHPWGDCPLITPPIEICSAGSAIWTGGPSSYKPGDNVKTSGLLNLNQNCSHDCSQALLWELFSKTSVTVAACYSLPLS